MRRRARRGRSRRMRRWSARTSTPPGRGMSAGRHQAGAAGGDPADAPARTGDSPKCRTRPTATTLARPGKDREALGQSRGGLTTRSPASGSAAGAGPGTCAGCVRRPGLRLASGLAQLRAPRQRPAADKPARSADKASAGRPALTARRGIKATIPEPADQIRHRLRRGSRGGRRPARPSQPAAQHKRAAWTGSAITEVISAR